MHPLTRRGLVGDPLLIGGAAPGWRHTFAVRPGVDRHDVARLSQPSGGRNGLQRLLQVAIVAVVFFLLLAVAALTSTVSLLEVVTSSLVDEWRIGRKQAAVGAHRVRVQMLNNADEYYGIGAWGSGNFSRGIGAYLAQYRPFAITENEDTLALIPVGADSAIIATEKGDDLRGTFADADIERARQ